jgi:hypothetical protein
MEPHLASQGVTVIYSPHGRDPPLGHDRVTRLGIAARIAALRGQEFGGEYDPAARYPGPVYFVPGDTLIGLEEARALGIGCEDDLFGAVVPHPFIATKAITHPLRGPEARAPEGWSESFGRRVEEVVLAGFTAFTPQDAWLAGVDLLESVGRLRVKPVREAGGRGQVVVSDASALETAIAAVDPAELAAYGLVLEQNLSRVTTHSVGQVRLAGMVASYWGTQRLTPDNSGLFVYGGSDLLIVPGGFDVLLATEQLSPEARLAVTQACAYDAAAGECFPGLFASRRNYDIAQGFDTKGAWRSGVLEQSWRIGGATGAEIAALEAFRVRPGLRRLRASTVELYGGDAGAPPPTPPPQAVVYFCGLDERCGPITKYVTVDDDHADA